MSEWLQVLEQKRKELGQATVGRELRKNQPDGFPSATTISQVLNDKYPGKTDRLQKLVEGIYMSSKVHCPVVGEIPTDQCSEYQNQEFAMTNPTRRALYQACRGGCQHSQLGE
jgi:hypothetical protein